jgi:quercetin dioxygenase-like cupin family protein
MSKSKRATIVLVGVTTLGLVVGLALATPPSELTATPLVRATLGKFKARHDGIRVRIRRPSADVAVTRITFGPGESAGWHHHPGVLLIAVKSGAVTHYNKNCKKERLTAGEAFVEATNAPGLVRNNGQVKAVVHVTFIVPTRTPDEGLRIDDPKPQGCAAR